MGLTLNLGVADIPYTYGDKNKIGNYRTKSSEIGTTSGQVAGWLENKYHPMTVYYNLEQDRINEWLGEAISGAIEDMVHDRSTYGVYCHVCGRDG